MDNLPEFFINLLEKQYGKEEAHAICDGLVKKKTSFRINRLKVLDSEKGSIIEVLKKDGIKSSSPSWYEDAFVLENAGNDYLVKNSFYEEGRIYVQNLSSMIPPLVLAPKEGEDILDMCAAPGGKTTELASLSNNKSHITACEMNKIRIERLKHNLEMQGASSVFIMPKDSRNLDDFLKFDKILLDSPCSGSGTLDRDDEKVGKYFTETLIQKSTKSQKLLINKAMKLLKKGGELVYSTCSILKEENEDIVAEALKNKNMELVPISLKDMEDIPYLNTTISGTLCVRPTNVYEGFFVAKLRRIS